MKKFTVGGHSVSILKRKQIDDIKWDECVFNAVNSQYYALTTFLDCISDDWVAVVLDDYKAVMPMPSVTKVGIKIIVQPVFCQQLGLFTASPSFLKISNEFLRAIKNEFNILTYSFNVLNELSPNKEIYKRRTYLLSLNKTYEDLYCDFSKNHKKNIKRATKKKLILKKSNDYDLFAKMYKKFHQDKNIHGIMAHNVEKFLRAARQLNGEVFFVVDNEENPVLAAYVIKHKKTYTFLSGNTGAGYNTRARYFFIDQLIKLKSGSENILDFAGSDIPAIAAFNAGFGALSHGYCEVRNSLFLRLVKIFQIAKACISWNTKRR